jgi:DNA-binding response OmpR family regulator
MEPKRILVVDDDAHLRTLLEVRLSHLGYKPLLAPDGATALGEAAQIKPDLIISDIMMPMMDGFEFCRRLRSSPGFENIPFIFLTALTGIEDRVLGLRLGADDYIVKPFDFRELQARIEVLLARHDRYEQTVPSIQKETTGRLSDLGLADIIQMLAFGRKTCQVELERADEQANLYFQEGKMTHAQSGKKTGTSALFHLLAWSDGHFTIRSDVTAPEPSVTQELEEILLEGIRQLDEFERMKHKLPDFTAIPHLTSNEPPAGFDPAVLASIDGAKSIQEIINTSPVADLAVVTAIARGYEQGFITFKDLALVIKPQPEAINLLVLGFDRQIRSRFIKTILSISGKGSTETTQLGDLGDIQLTETLAIQLLGVSSMKHFAPFWLSLAQRSQGFIVLETGAVDEETARFASRFLKEQTRLTGIVLKLVDKAQATKIEVVNGLQKVECYWENKTQLEKLLKDLAGSITQAKP